ncbi:MAG: hypothetical protein GWN00_35585 [Aliifodinibius sp.]|nr:hypothetical protein [candidate division Zixibacteria bacterium]NIR67412.1 hypothetical protein [candidate division Zixibacteria bacterium]NIT61341.1 hypothetical protein [Fodinibius sp.]NIY29921.1 hypothetical protein [Fodinibius sp.]
MSELKPGGDDRERRAVTIGESDVLSLELTAATTQVADITGLAGAGQVVGISYICPATDTDTTFNVNFLSESVDGSSNRVEIGSSDGLTCATGGETVGHVETTSDNVYLGSGNHQVQVEFSTTQSITVQLVLRVK